MFRSKYVSEAFEIDLLDLLDLLEDIREREIQSQRQHGYTVQSALFKQ